MFCEEAEIGIDDPALDTPRPEELPFVERLSIWQAREAGHYEPSGATASTEFYRLTPRGEEDRDPLVVDGDAPRMRWRELQRDHPILPRLANLTDLRGDEDSSDDDDWASAQRRVDAEANLSGGLPLASVRPAPQPYVPFQPELIIN